jgi:hypothetical protein
MRHTARKATWIAGVVSLAALLSAPGSATGADTEPLPLSLCDPDQNTFNLNIDNDFFPLPVGQQWIYTGKEQGQTIGLRITVLNRTESLYSGQDKVSTRVVEELEWVDADADGVVDRGEFVIERSLNYYAQTQDGTVCYFGEAVDIFNEDGSVTHEGAWRADDPGNAPGIFMPADPAVGRRSSRSRRPESQRTRRRSSATAAPSGYVRVPAGTFSDAITVRDFNSLDGSRGTKVYARDVGLVRDGPLDLVGYSAPLNS